MDLEATRRELEEVQERMAKVVKEAEIAVDASWQSSYRSPAVFDLKVQSRLSSSKDYLGMITRARELQAELEAAGESA